jgi:hypothetical protein
MISTTKVLSLYEGASKWCFSLYMGHGGLIPLKMEEGRFRGSYFVRELASSSVGLLSKRTLFF